MNEKIQFIGLADEDENQEPFTIDNFQEYQKKNRDSTKESIEKYSEKCRKIV